MSHTQILGTHTLIQVRSYSTLGKKVSKEFSSRYASTRARWQSKRPKLVLGLFGGNLCSPRLVAPVSACFNPFSAQAVSQWIKRTKQAKPTPSFQWREPGVRDWGSLTTTTNKQTKRNPQTRVSFANGLQSGPTGLEKFEQTRLSASLSKEKS